MTDIIRLIEEKDFERCEQICKVGFKEGGYDYDAVKGFRESIDPTTSRRVYVFERDGVIVGLCGINNVYFSDGIYGIDSCYISAEHRYTGVGTKLVIHILDELRSIGVDLCFLTTRKTAFFERFGFKVLDTGREDWPIMSIKLNTIQMV